MPYAQDKGVNVYGWDHWRNLDTPEKREKILGYFVKHGFKGIKVDFLDSDSQEPFRFREIIARECAVRKLMLSYHGETMPRGQQRRWPNIATLEGVKGEEYYLFARGPTPAYNVNSSSPGTLSGRWTTARAGSSWSARHFPGEPPPTP